MPGCGTNGRRAATLGLLDCRTVGADPSRSNSCAANARGSTTKVPTTCTSGSTSILVVGLSTTLLGGAVTLAVISMLFSLRVGGVISTGSAPLNTRCWPRMGRLAGTSTSSSPKSR